MNHAAFWHLHAHLLQGKRWHGPMHIFHLELLNYRTIRCGSCFRSTFWSRVFNTPTFPRNEPVSDTMLQQPVCTQAAPVGRSVNNCGSMHASRSFPHNYAREYAYRVFGVRFGMTDSSDNSQPHDIAWNNQN